MRRRATVLLAMMGAGLIGLSALWLAHPRPRIDKVGFEQIVLGMTNKEVELVLECAPGDYSTGPLEVKSWPEDELGIMMTPLAVVQKVIQEFNEEGKGRICLWSADAGIIVVRFDKNNCVVEKEFKEGWVRPSGGVLRRIACWIGL